MTSCSGRAAAIPMSGGDFRKFICVHAAMIHVHACSDVSGMHQHLLVQGGSCRPRFDRERVAGTGPVLPRTHVVGVVAHPACFAILHLAQAMCFHNEQFSFHEIVLGPAVAMGWHRFSLEPSA